MSEIRTLGPVGLNPLGEYNSQTEYEKLDVVLYQGSSYVALKESIGQLPTNTEYWDCIAVGYLKQNTYDSVADMKADDTLKDGMYAQTVGYYSANDGGAAIYKITNEESETEYQEELDNGLYATLTIKNGEICFNQIGGKADDNTFDNYTILVKGLNLINNSKLCLLFTGKNYYFSTPISDITLHSCRLASNISSTLTYTGTGWFITFTTTNNATIENLRFTGNSSNKGINFGDTNSYRTSLKNVQFNNFTNSAYIGRSAYFYIDKCNFYANTSNDILLELGQRVGKYANELITINDSIFAGGETLDSTGDFIRINQVMTLRITNSDFANTLGRWIYFNNSSTGDIYDIQIDGCTFTRAKNGIVFDLTTAAYLMNIIFDKPLFSLYGNWSDGETNIVTVNRTGEGAIQNGMFRDVSIIKQNNNYSPSHFIYDSSNSTRIFVNFLRRPNVANYSNSGVLSINQSYTLTAENNATLGDTTYSQDKITNLVSYTGRIANSTESAISAYTELASGFLEPLGGINAVIIGITNDGTCYPFYIENGHIKCRKGIPAGTNIRIHTTYTTRNN